MQNACLPMTPRKFGLSRNIGDTKVSGSLLACPFRWFALYTWDGEIVWICMDSMVSSVLQLMLQEPFKLPNRSLPHKFGAYGIVSS